jgi:hypothetical protein
MTKDTDSSPQVVLDEDRQLEFSGRLLSEVSTYERGKTRWAELRIFKTDEGRYVVAGVGKSEVPGEVDRPWATISDTPVGVIERLVLVDSDGLRYLPRSSRVLVLQAAQRDEGIKEAYAVEYVQ